MNIRSCLSKSIVVFFIVLTMCVAGFYKYSLAADWSTASDTVKERARTMAVEAENISGQADDERRKATISLEQRQQAVAQAQKELQRLQAIFDSLLQEEESLRVEIGDEEESIKTLEGAIRQAAKEADHMISDNVLTSIRPERRDILEPLLLDHSFPGVSSITSLIDLHFEEIELSRNVHNRSGRYTAPDGTQTQGKIIYAGPFSAYFINENGETGFLTPSEDGKELRAVAGNMPQSDLQHIKSYLNNQSPALPVDLSHGAVFQRLKAEKSWREWLEAGGFLVWPILFVGGLGLLLGLERCVTLASKKAFSAKRMQEITRMVADGEIEKCREYCSRGKSFPACRMLGSALNHVGESQEVLENALQESILRELPRLERFLPTMNVLAAIAPLLGLLGTVTGMINTFQVITLFGSGDPRMMSGGISEALVTTQLGLAVAIPIMVLHHFFERRVDSILGDMEQKGTAFTVALLRTGAVENESGPGTES